MATTTKCMSKMLKKELYEYCKTLITENQKLQLFNNSQEQEIEELKAQVGIHTEKYGGTMVFPSVYNKKKQKCKKLKKEIEELKKDLEYFQNKCEIMEKELIGEEKTTFILSDMNQEIIEELAKKEDTIIKLEKELIKKEEED